jgi:hypothetical protein
MIDLCILIIKKERQAINVKVMAQSCANIANDVILDLEKKIESICKGASSYYNSLFKKLSFKNPQNAQILYEFLITEQNYQNVKLNEKIDKRDTNINLLSLIILIILLQIYN